MYQAREERVEIENPQEEPQSGTTESEVKETQEMLSEEKTRKRPDELRTQENDGPMLVESIKPKTGQALMTCKEEIVSSSDDETDHTQANHVQESTDEAIEKTGPTSPALDPFSPEVTETEGESEGGYPLARKKRECLEKGANMDEESERKSTMGEKYRHINETNNNEAGDISLQMFMDRYSQMERITFLCEEANRHVFYLAKECEKLFEDHPTLVSNVLDQTRARTWLFQARELIKMGLTDDGENVAITQRQPTPWIG